MYTEYKLNKQGDYIQPCHTPFPILNQSIFPCPILTVVSWLAYRFHTGIQERGKMVWYSHLFKNFPQFVVIHAVKNFSLVNETEADIFWKSFAFSMVQQMFAVWSLVPLPLLKLRLYIWKFLVHVLLKPSLKDFECNHASMWNECNYIAVWRFFGIALLWDLNEN